MTTTAPAADRLAGEPPEPLRRRAGFVPADLTGRILSRYGLIVVFLLLVAVFSIARPDTYLTAQNAQTIASGKAVVGLLALAAMVPLIVGQFDLSVGFQLGLTQTICAGLMLKQDQPVLVAVAATIAVGLTFGLVNGLLVVKARMNAFIATLATGTIAAGFTLWYSNGESIFGSVSPSFLSLGRDEIAGVPLPLVYVLAIAAILWLVFEYTSWGRSAFAIGGNARAARIAGVDVDRQTVQCFVLAGLLASSAGLLSVMILGSADPNVGPDFLLPAFAGAFLGATSIRPGRFNAWGTVLAVYLLAAGITGLQQLGAASYIEQFFNGGALLLAVALSAWATTRRRNRAAEE